MLDIAIIGGGPAGLAAGLYAKRGGAKVKLFEEMFAGGQIVKTHRVDNYLGFSDGPDGYALGAAFETHVQKFGLAPDYTPVLGLELSTDRKVLILPNEKIEAKTVILCMGASPRLLGAKGEDRFTGNGISYCATCDGAFYRDKTVAVIGGGDTAISDAVYLSAMCKKVYIIHRRDALRASDSLQKSAFSKPNIEVVWNVLVDEFTGDAMLDGLLLRDKLTGEQRRLEVDGAFVAVGITPRTELVNTQLKLHTDGSIITDEFMETSIHGVFAAGDIRHKPLRQVITACADGAIAATRALELC